MNKYFPTFARWFAPAFRAIKHQLAEPKGFTGIEPKITNYDDAEIPQPQSPYYGSDWPDHLLSKRKRHNINPYRRPLPGGTSRRKRGTRAGARAAARRRQSWR